MPKNVDFNSMKSDEVAQLLHTDPEHGLAYDEINKRIKEQGYNEVPEKKTPTLVIFLRKFWGLNAWSLEFIILISLVLRNYTDFYIVTALLILNSILGFVQEYQASGAVEALKKNLQANARVLRDNGWSTVPARELVCGDIVRVRTGDFVPADIKMTKGDVWLDQSALTGESMEAEKKPNDLLYSGSVVTRGEANGIIVFTGVDTYFGRTVQLVQIARPKLHIEDVISDVIRSLLMVIALMVLVGLAISFLHGMDMVKILPLFLVLLLTAIPVALPTMFTVTLALGSNKLVKKNVLVTRLSASDDAASMDILCADKTGTITMNKLSVARITTENGYTENDVLLFGALASKEANNDPIDMAFINSARAKNLLPGSFVRKKFIPFDPSTRRTEAIMQGEQEFRLMQGEQEFRLMKGAFDVIAKLCKLEEEQRQSLEAKASDFASKGCKTIAVAISRQGQTGIAGLVALQDMPREDSPKFIKDLKELGVSVKMLTGDALPIAKEIAAHVGLGPNILSISEFKKIAQESPEKAIEIAEKADGFAEIYPEDKYLIVKNLQAGGHIVGMTGDGVNDALALKQAEVGIATSNATDVAKGAASIVLTKEGLSSIPEPIKIGRMMFQTINTWILQKIGWTVLMTSLVVISLILTGKFVLSSSAALLMLLFTDFGKISLSTDNTRWSQKPEVWKINDLVKVGIVLALLILAESLALLFLGSKYFGIFSNDRALSTFTFEILFYFATFSIIIVRERGHFWESMPSKILLGALAFDSVAATVISTIGLLGLDALPLQETAFVLISTLACTLTINDLAKLFMINKLRLNNGKNHIIR